MKRRDEKAKDEEDEEENEKGKEERKRRNRRAVEPRVSPVVGGLGLRKARLGGSTTL